MLEEGERIKRKEERSKEGKEGERRVKRREEKREGSWVNGMGLHGRRKGKWSGLGLGKRGRNEEIKKGGKKEGKKEKREEREKRD